MSQAQKKSLKKKRKSSSNPSSVSSYSTTKELPITERESMSKNFFTREVQSFRTIFSKNILITVSSMVLLVALLPYLARYVFINLWTYAHENIVVHVNIYEIFGEDDTSGLNIIDGLINSVVTTIIGNFLLEIRWIVTFMARVVRFVYLIILATMVVYLVLYFFLSLIMQNRVNFRAVFISVIIASLSSFAVTYFLIPNNVDMMNMFIELGTQLVESPDILDAIPLLVIDIIYTFYFGFLILVGLTLFLSSGIEYILSRW